MRPSGSAKVVMAAGSQGLVLFPAHSGLSFAATSAVFRATGKKISSGPLDCFYFTGFLPEPS